MASYGSFITACGFEYHGPKGYMRFAPKWNADNFKAPFTAAEGWGSYSQRQSSGAIECALEPKYGQVQLNSFSVDVPKGVKARKVTVSSGNETISATCEQKGITASITLSRRATVKVGEELRLRIEY
jgi:hypothetical protein